MAHLLSLASMTLEILNGAFVFLGRCARLERAEIAAPAGLRVDLARIEPVAAGLELADHRRLLAASAWRILRFPAHSCALVAIVRPPSMVSTRVNRREPTKVPAHLKMMRQVLQVSAPAVGAISVKRQQEWPSLSRGVLELKRLPQIFRNDGMSTFTTNGAGPCLKRNNLKS